jgi:hypothetical protein
VTSLGDESLGMDPTISQNEGSGMNQNHYENYNAFSVATED